MRKVTTGCWRFLPHQTSKTEPWKLRSRALRAPGAPTDARGFIGVLFHVQDHGEKAENFYLRPTNGRADDQLRRNHSVQYVSEPEFPWARLRQETPGVYESYTDLEPSVWTHVKIVVAGVQARLYVNHAAQPCL